MKSMRDLTEILTHLSLGNRSDVGCSDTFAKTNAFRTALSKFGRCKIQVKHGDVVHLAIPPIDLVGGVFTMGLILAISLKCH